MTEDGQGLHHGLHRRGIHGQPIHGQPNLSWTIYGQPNNINTIILSFNHLVPVVFLQECMV
jgi:hypothetical protein